MTEAGLKNIKKHLENGQWRENEKILGVLYYNPKKFVSYCLERIERKQGGKKQLEALYRHAANITMHFKGLTDEEIKNYWWGEMKKAN